MTPDVLRKVFRAIRDCLRNSSVGELPADWETRLIEPHLEFPERSRVLTTYVGCEFAHKPGWVVIGQTGGGVDANLFCPDAKPPDSEARAAVEALYQCLTAVLSHNVVWIRYIHPRDWLARKGVAMKEAHSR